MVVLNTVLSAAALARDVVRGSVHPFSDVHNIKNDDII